MSMEVKIRKRLDGFVLDAEFETGGARAGRSRTANARLSALANGDAPEDVRRRGKAAKR